MICDENVDVVVIGSGLAGLAAAIGNSIAAGIGNAIAEMLEIDIRPALPDVSQSLRALQVRQKLMQEIAPSGMEGNGDSGETGAS